MVTTNSNSLPPISPVSTTTFVQADAATFRELVQQLTGVPADSDTKLPVTHPSRKPNNYNFINNINNSSRRSPYKLQERRQTIRKLEIKLSRASLRTSPCSSPYYSPVVSPVTPLMGSPFFSSAETSPSPSTEEERAIAEKRFYLHPSPRLSTPRRGNEDPPELLPLFPLTSPTVKLTNE
ncbi:VQ motif-containing protein 11 [Linum grandiflorum]